MLLNEIQMLDIYLYITS